MVILDEVKRRLSELAPEVTDLHDALAIERSRVRLEELEQKSASPEFYDDAAASGAVFAEMGELKDRLEQYAALQTMLEDAETLLEMCAEDDDPALAEEADAAVNSLDAKVEELRLVTLLNGEYDANNAILTFHAGAGGTEAQDWVEMLYRMYTRFAARHNWTVKVLDYLEGDEAGIKSASILVEGHNAYGFFAQRKRRAPPGACFALRCLRAPPYQLCLAGGHAGAGRRHHCGDQAGGHQNGGVPLLRRGRTAHQQDKQRRASHPYSYGHRGELPERAQPVPEPRHVYEDAGREAVSDQRARASGQDQ